MPIISAGNLLVRSLCMLGGLGILYYSRIYKLTLKASFTGVGWLLIGLAVFCWSALEGWEFGLIYGATLPSWSAFTFVVLNAWVNEASIDEYMGTKSYLHLIVVSKLAENLISDKRIKLRSNSYTTLSLNSQLVSFGKGVFQADLAFSYFTTAISHEKT